MTLVSDPHFDDLAWFDVEACPRCRRDLDIVECGECETRFCSQCAGCSVRVDGEYAICPRCECEVGL